MIQHSFPDTVNLCQNQTQVTQTKRSGHPDKEVVLTTEPRLFHGLSEQQNKAKQDKKNNC